MGICGVNLHFQSIHHQYIGLINVLIALNGSGPQKSGISPKAHKPQNGTISRSA